MVKCENLILKSHSHHKSNPFSNKFKSQIPHIISLISAGQKFLLICLLYYMQTRLNCHFVRVMDYDDCVDIFFALSGATQVKM